MDQGRLSKYIDVYIERFEDIHGMHERYKWEAVQHFQNIFDINSADFADMLKAALSKTGNLLTGSHFLAYDTIIRVTREFPTETRQLLISLYDESPMTIGIRIVSPLVRWLWWIGNMSHSDKKM